MTAQSKRLKNEERLAHIRTTVKGPSAALMDFSNESDNKVEEKQPEKNKEELVVKSEEIKSEEIKTASSQPENVSVKPVINEVKEVKQEVKQSPKQQSPKNKNKVVEESNDDSKSSLLQELKAKGKKKRIEDTHTRCTYLVRNDLEKRVNAYAEGNFGFKTSFINYAIEAALEDYDKIYNEEDE